MNNNDQSANKDDKNFDKSNSFEHMIAMQEQIFNPPIADDENKPVTDFSSFGGNKVTNVNDLAERKGIDTEGGEEKKEKTEDFVDSRSEAEMHSLFSDPSAGTTQDVDPEEKRILDEERRAEEMARRDEELSVVIPPRVEKKEEPESLIPTPAEEHHEEEKKEEAAEEKKPEEAPKEEEHHEEEHHDEAPVEEHHEEASVEEHYDEAPAKEEHHEEAPAEEENHEEAPAEEEHHEDERHEEEKRDDAPAEEEHHDEESHEETPVKEEHHDEPPTEEEHHDEVPVEEHHEEAPTEEEHHDDKPAPAVAASEETEPKTEGMHDMIRKRLERLRVERNVLIVDIDKLEDGLFDENNPNNATAKDQIKDKHHELRHINEVIAGLIDLLHNL